MIHTFYSELRKHFFPFNPSWEYIAVYTNQDTFKDWLVHFAEDIFEDVVRKRNLDVITNRVMRDYINQIWYASTNQGDYISDSYIEVAVDTLKEHIQKYGFKANNFSYERARAAYAANRRRCL